MKLVSGMSVFAVLLLAMGASEAATVPYADDFDSSPFGSGVAPAGWGTVSGTVDHLQDNTSGFRCFGDAGGCVDLQGGTSGLSILQSESFQLSNGVTYQLSATISGNQRQEIPNVVTFGLTDGISNLTTMTLNLAWNAPFSVYSLLFTPGTNGSPSDPIARIFFQSSGPPGRGAILDNVTFAEFRAVPTPSTLWLLVSGLACLGLFAIRRAA